MTSPFLYCFSRLAILEPLLTAFTLARSEPGGAVPQLRRPMPVSAVDRLLFTLMMLTKTTAIFLLPALGWAMLLPLRQQRKLDWRFAALRLRAVRAVVSFGRGCLVARLGLMTDYQVSTSS